MDDVPYTETSYMSHPATLHFPYVFAVYICRNILALVWLLIPHYAVLFLQTVRMSVSAVQRVLLTGNCRLCTKILSPGRTRNVPLM
jgi:hypothetical protein